MVRFWASAGAAIASPGWDVSMVLPACHRRGLGDKQGGGAGISFHWPSSLLGIGAEWGATASPWTVRRALPWSARSRLRQISKTRSPRQKPRGVACAYRFSKHWLARPDCDRCRSGRSHARDAAVQRTILPSSGSGPVLQPGADARDFEPNYQQSRLERERDAIGPPSS